MTPTKKVLDFKLLNFEIEFPVSWQVFCLFLFSYLLLNLSSLMATHDFSILAFLAILFPTSYAWISLEFCVVPFYSFLLFIP